MQVGTTALRAGKTDHAGRSDEKESGGASEPDWNRAYGGIPVGRNRLGKFRRRSQLYTHSGRRAWGLPHRYHNWCKLTGDSLVLDQNWGIRRVWLYTNSGRRARARSEIGTEASAWRNTWEKDHFETNRWRGGGYAGVYGMRERRELGIGPYDWKATGSGEWAVGRVKS